MFSSKTVFFAFSVRCSCGSCPAFRLRPVCPGDCQVAAANGPVSRITQMHAPAGSAWRPAWGSSSPGHSRRHNSARAICPREHKKTRIVGILYGKFMWLVFRRGNARRIGGQWMPGKAAAQSDNSGTRFRMNCCNDRQNLRRFLPADHRPGA